MNVLRFLGNLSSCLFPFSFQLILGQPEIHLCLFNIYYTFLQAVDGES